MKCPKCGAELPQNIYTCSKCGYSLKVSERPDPFAEPETQDVRPSQARFKKPKQSGGGFFGGGMGNVFGSLFGDFFNDDDSDSGYDADPKNYDDFGNPVQVPDEFDRESIEINDIEFVQDDDNDGDKKRKK